MAKVEVFTSARSKQIEDTTVVSGVVVGDNLVLTRRDQQTINAGNVRGAAGPTGPPGEVTNATLNAAIADLNTQISNLNAALTANGATTRAMIAPDAIDATKLADAVVNAEHLANPSTFAIGPSGCLKGFKLGKLVVLTTSLDGAATLDVNTLTIPVGFRPQVTLMTVCDYNAFDTYAPRVYAYANGTMSAPGNQHAFTMAYAVA